MNAIVPYLFFGGRCAEALELYTNALNGRVSTTIRLGEVNPQASEEHKDWLLHAELEVGGRVLLMAGDGMPSALRPEGAGPVSLAVDCESTDEQDRILAKLRAGGEVVVEPHDTFYGGRMAVVTDRYGINWILNWIPAREA
jgi:PhnB protein